MVYAYQRSSLAGTATLLLAALIVGQVVGQNANDYVSVIRTLPEQPDPFIYCNEPGVKGSWQLNGNATIARQGTAYAGLGDLQFARMIVAGGREDDGSRVAPTRIKSAEIYRVDEDSWSSLPDMTTARDEAAGVAVPPPDYNFEAPLPEHMLPAAWEFAVMGGYNDEDGILGSGEMLSLVSETWQSLPPLAIPRYAHSMAVWLNYRIQSRVLIVAGGDDGHSHQDTVEMWAMDAPNTRWRVIPARLKIARYGGRALVVRNSTLFVAGGAIDGSGMIEYCSLDFGCPEFISLPPMHTPRIWAAVEYFPPMHAIIVASGYRDNTGPQDRIIQDSEVYLIHERRWEVYPWVRYARYSTASSMLRVHGPQGMIDYRMYIASGFNTSGGRTSSMEEFSCYHTTWTRLAPASSVVPSGWLAATVGGLLAWLVAQGRRW
eukprot:CAMPEP_0196777980 /NCGR_PEP_ID=MMETSP1104-20130614/5534_1 /TAXON_ID=33652 /ORGANISM="Cafeteria sp., Strain Caron Lab Isolate" /LENGTH=431 /DNA_ID=CAMNT_0042148149 /DNA_START=88 /DNA_END=1383 /DNA_ORIENTATION=+